MQIPIQYEESVVTADYRAASYSEKGLVSMLLQFEPSEESEDDEFEYDEVDG